MSAVQMAAKTTDKRMHFLYQIKALFDHESSAIETSRAPYALLCYANLPTPSFLPQIKTSRLSHLTLLKHGGLSDKPPL